MKSIEKNSRSAFSLVEVTLALGILSFCLLAILGLLPTGLNLIKESSDETMAINVAAAINAELRGETVRGGRSAIFEIPLEAGKGKSYFDIDGKFLDTIEGDRDEDAPADAVYAGNWEIRGENATLPPTALITVRWPAKAREPSHAVEVMAVMLREPAS